jgi:hypothetical protein
VSTCKHGGYSTACNQGARHDPVVISNVCQDTLAVKCGYDSPTESGVTHVADDL